MSKPSPKDPKNAILTPARRELTRKMLPHLKPIVIPASERV